MHGDGERLIARARQLRQPAGEAQVVRLEADDLAIGRARLVEVQPEIDEQLLGVLDALANLLQVAFAGAAAAIARVDVLENLVVDVDVALGDRDELAITHDVDIGLGGIERDEFGALENAGGRGIDARGLPPDLVHGREAIEQKLAHDDRGFLAVQPLIIAERRWRDVLVVTLGAGPGFETNLRKAGRLGLAHLGFGRAAVGGRFANARVIMDCLLDRVGDRERFTGLNGCNRACNNCQSYPSPKGCA